MSTLQPRAPYTDAELSALYPPHLKLQHVQILLRHGERTPVSWRFANAGVPAFWPYCTALRHFKSAVLDPEASPASASPGSGAPRFTTFEWKRRLEAFGGDDAAVVATGPKGEVDDVCDMGMLTDKGRETTYYLGKRLRNLYVDRLGFLPASLGADSSFLYLRASPIPRALESLQQTFLGLYPTHTRLPEYFSSPPPTIISRSPADETLFPNDANCRRLAVMFRAFADRAAKKWNDTDDMAYLNRKIGKWMPADSPRVAVDAHPRLSGVMDSINATDAHGPSTKLPSEFYDPKVRQIINNIGVQEWFDGYRESKEYRTLGIGGLLADMTARMVGSAEKSTADGEYELINRPGQDPSSRVRLGLSGCHDTTLAAVLTSLGAYDDIWPPFTSHIAVELFRHADPASQTSSSPSSTAAAASKSWSSSLFGWATKFGTPPPGIGRKRTENLTPNEKAQLDGYYVRVRYNDTPVTIPGCKVAGNHLNGDESFCTLAAFKAIVDKITPDDWRAQCRANIPAPSIPSEPEAAGYA